MGLLDDLAMGFGLKERTEDYDARTARNIAVSEQYDNEFDRIRARQSGDYDVTRGGAAQFLGSRGRDNYNPQIAQDDRSFGQRFLFSPEGAPSPTPYAIGPVTMDQPLPKFGILGMLSGLGGLLGGGTQQMSPPRTTVRPMLRPDEFTPPKFPTGNGQPETTFTEDFSGVETADFEKPMSIDALNTLVTSALQNVPDAPAGPSDLPKVAPNATEFDINFLENTRVPRPIDLERPLPVMPKDPTYYGGIDVNVPATPRPPVYPTDPTAGYGGLGDVNMSMPSPNVMRLPNGLLVDKTTGRVFR